MLLKNTIYTVVLLGTVLLMSLGVAAQTPEKFPEFGMTLSSGRYFHSAEISKNKPVVLIYFAPDCDHCHTLMNQFFKKAGEFRTAEVIMVTYKPASELAVFEKAWNTHQYSNMKVGTEGSSNHLRMFYKLQNTPFTALYNKEGKLVSSYRKETPVLEIIKKLKQL